ncbi:uncharacterized protein LOC124279695 isoform X3 [Haliotis rubra]|uniref:uncharacterized protein LOC124279695 isoform X3 n=1 Tax=Haliotis rubra TaxID=36100 RepID=UPI001EE59CA1|nr:uncharacterized protein LOC124279695 isoform X3 [Haliotis rubra]XP_046571487.1 uncharacterized protein LOC124279695 isoform X3 [Haliotis rubra]
MTDIWKKGDTSTVTDLRGCYSFGPTVKHSGESFSEILDYFNSLQEEEKGVKFTLFPPKFDQELQEDEQHVISTVREYLVAKKGGVAFFQKSISNLLGLKTASDVICDVIILTPTDVPYLLTFAKDKEATSRRNRDMAKLVLRRLRMFVSVDFTLAFGVVGVEDDAADVNLFSQRLQHVKSSSTSFALRTYMIITNSKYESLVRGLVAMYATAKTPTENGYFGNSCKHNSKSIWIMQKDAFKTIYAAG